MRIQGFFISNSLINNPKLKNIILYYDCSPSVTGAFSGIVFSIVFSYPGITLLPTNTFFGLYYFYLLNNTFSYQFSFTFTQYS